MSTEVIPHERGTTDVLKIMNVKKIANAEERLDIALQSQLEILEFALNSRKLAEELINAYEREIDPDSPITQITRSLQNIRAIFGKVKNLPKIDFETKSLEILQIGEEIGSLLGVLRSLDAELVQSWINAAKVIEELKEDKITRIAASSKIRSWLQAMHKMTKNALEDVKRVEAKEAMKIHTLQFT